MRAPLLLLTCNLCLAIRVPVAWDHSASEVKQHNNNEEQFSVESFQPQNVPLNADSQNKPIPVDYFQYTAQKPQFAVNVAKFHGVQSPENHYKAYPVKPYTGQVKPELGKHHILDPKNTIHKPLQEFASINEGIPPNHAVPVSSNYEVFHPYEAETPALQEIYKDPILTKIRNDLENSKNRLQNYEKDAGEPNIQKDEYLEPPEKTDDRFVPHRNVPAPYEIHRPQRRPVYYRPGPKIPHREQYLNQRLRHPWNQYSAKIRPLHYRPIKNHIQNLRQNHALKYDDERNEYPQVHIMENYSSDPQDGYDIYEKGKENFVRLRNNVDESIIKAVKQNRPVTYEKLEIQNNDNANDEEDEEEFVPIKNYAQVRKSETYKHLPRTAAFEDAENFDEIRNAPRLREAVKSTKAQTVYSEEGYEDTAYDHAGEQKHASENEAHGGILKEHELSGGKYKTPSESAKYEDAGGSAYRDQVLHAEKWKDDSKDNEQESHAEDYSEVEQEHSIEADGFDNPDNEENIHRNKREDTLENDNISEKPSTTGINDMSSTHEIEKRHYNFNVPDIDLNSTLLTEKEILKLGYIKTEPKKDDLKQKYPYYFKKLKAISKHSPLRYAENIKHIPRKSKGGTEFYDSRSAFECPGIDDVPDPVPQKLKGEGHPDENDDENEENAENKGDENYNTAKKTPRLKGLGDKIDCFKAKYFGENPLDSPFFKEEMISNPEPVTLPNLGVFKLKNSGIDQKKLGSEVKTIFIEKESKSPEPNIYDVLEKIRNNQNQLQDSVLRSTTDLKSGNSTDLNSTHSNLKQQTFLYADILDNIRNNFNNTTISTRKHVPIIYNSATTEAFEKANVTYQHFQNAEDVTKSPILVRKRRSTAFVYEPYKIIKDSQVQDSKKTTTTSNISPLIRQLQSSRIVDRVPRPTQDIDKSDSPVKRNVRSRTYKDIGRKDRGVSSKNDKGASDPTIVDISLDSRRGEPRYEIRHANHKSRYMPVENKKALSVSDYRTQTSTDKNLKSQGDNGNQRQSRQKTQFKSNLGEQNEAASSNTVQNKISATSAKPEQTKIELRRENEENDEDYEEYDDDEEEEEEDTVITTTTTTQKPSFRRRIRLPTSTERINRATEKPKLKLVTRFRNYNPDQEDDSQKLHSTKSGIERVNEKSKQESDESAPKYREKKKKSTKSTLVTDTKRYGEDDHDMRKEEVDALIGVKEDMSDYMPLYEKEENEKLRQAEQSENDEEDDESNESDDTDEDDNDSEDDEEDKDEDDDTDEDEENSNEPEVQVITPEPTKQTLPMTTDTPLSTSTSRILKPETKPIVTRKKIEIHKELPVDKSAPHVTQFKQDIKEVEIVKEIPKTPRRKLQKNLEALELYKDDNLAKEVNKLGGVEIFRDDIDLKNGPRHGGNYRSLEEPSAPAPLRQARKKLKKEDAEASQSEFTKHVELEDDVASRNQMHGGNLRALNDASRTRSRGRNSKLIDITKPSPAPHGTNFKHHGRSNSQRSQKLIELGDEEQSENDPSNDHESFSSSADSGPMHGGNYRSEQLIVSEQPKVVANSRNVALNARKTSAAILSSFVQAAPVLTSTPKFILDPSKRMYYYVDA